MKSKQVKPGKQKSTRPLEQRPRAKPPGLPEEQNYFIARNGQRKKLLPKALALGLLSGLLAVVFRYCLVLGEQMRGELLRLGPGQGAFGLFRGVDGCRWVKRPPHLRGIAGAGPVALRHGDKSFQNHQAVVSSCR
ncbi:MAG: hypothetical protein NTX45_02775 [Proteobacteria bacterium]|nr:hypothetical protein [Pseudomonadota bacterium]